MDWENKTLKLTQGSPLLRKKLLALIAEATSWVEIPTNGPNGNDMEREFDLDQLWATPRYLVRTIEIISKAARESGVQYDAVAAITSNVGSFGTTPLATGLAIEKNKKLIIFVETEFGRYYVAPLSLNDDAFFRAHKILLVKDILVGGRSLVNVGALIAKHEGTIAGIISLINMNPKPQPAIDATNENTVFIYVLSGSDIKDLGGKTK